MPYNQEISCNENLSLEDIFRLIVVTNGDGYAIKVVEVS